MVTTRYINVIICKTNSLYNAKRADLFNWNKVMVAYCDGGAFTGDVERVDPVCYCIKQHNLIISFILFTIWFYFSCFENGVCVWGLWWGDMKL